MTDNAAGNACIFLKNPVFQKGSPLSSPLSATSDLRSLQIYGVTLTGLDGSGYLQNSTFAVAPSGLTRATADGSGNWKFPYSTCSAGSCTVDPNHQLGQVMAYYWLSKQEQVMVSRTGKFYSSGKAIPVDTYKAGYNNASFDRSVLPSGKITMGVNGTGNEYALSAEIYNHEMGHANFYHANPSAGYSTATHQYCGTSNQYVCCKTTAGCLLAINEGQADYHAAIVFNEAVALGEALVNNIAGFSECGLLRAISANTNTTNQATYDACGSRSQLGEPHLMGRVYASVWWMVRSKAGNNPQEVDRLFTEHLAVLSSSDTFATALVKIQTLDSSLFGGKYSSDFAAEFARR
jgi:hypothetical protein